MSKRTGPTNPVLQGLILELKKSNDDGLWRRIAVDLEKPTRQRRVVNLSSLTRHTKENEVVVVPGKILGAGNLDHKITVSAYQFSNGAREKIEKAGAKVVSLLELSKTNPTGKGIRIIG